LYPDVSIYTKASLTSDYAPILMNLKGCTDGGRRKWMFKYDNQWAMEENCRKVVKQVWHRKYHYGDKWMDLKRKLDSCQEGLLKWKKKHIGSAANEI
jgi:hypothetical protein